MRAILIASAPLSGWPELGERHGACSLPLGDRPFLQHVVERLVQVGIREVDVVLSEHPGEAEALLGDGTRWGIDIRHHLARDPDRVYDKCRLVAHRASSSCVLLVRGDRLLPDGELSDGGRPPETPILYFADGDEEAGSVWTGWAWLPAPLLARLPAGRGRRASEGWLVAEGLLAGRTETVAPALAARPISALLAAQRRLLMGELPELLLGGREDRPGVWLGRGATVDPSAVLLPPVLLGERVRIGRAARVGPNVVVGDRSFVGPETRLSEGLVLADSFVGEALELRQAVVDRSLIAHLAMGAELPIDESALLSGLGRRDPLRPPRLGSRLAAILGLAVGWPLLLLTALGVALRERARPLRGRRVVSLPATTDPSGWRSFELLSFVDAGELPEEGLAGPADLLLRVLPGLLNVAAGELSLMGLRPRSEDELRAMPPHWRRMCLGARCGLITEAYLEHGPRPSREEAFAAECLQVATSSPTARIRRLVRYLGRLLRPARRPVEAATTGP